MIFTFCRLWTKLVDCLFFCVVCRIKETLQNKGPFSKSVGNKKLGIMKAGRNKKRMTASEKRFAREIEQLIKMSLEDLMTVEQNRMPVGV